MKDKTIGMLAVGLVAGLALGSIGIASAATISKTASSAATTASSTAQPGTPRDLSGRGGKGGRGGEGDLPEALAKLSGMTVEEVRAQREAGKSFADIAKAKGVSTDALIAETVKIETAELDAEVKAGTMTAAQRTAVLSDIETRLKSAVTSTDVGHRGNGGHGPDDGSSPSQ